MASLIKALPGHSVHKITSGQVVIDLQAAVKELVENSLDAQATNIEVRFKDYGLKSIEVIDNGTGIKPVDFEAIGLKHHTSKLTTYSDLSTVTSFGFRGEAISSLCALSESVVIVTATEGEAPMGTVLEFDRSGLLKSSSTKIARQRGTTVTVTNLFAPLPVRRAELHRNIRREHQKAVALLTAYAMVPCSRPPGVRLVVSNQPDGGKKTIQIRTDGTPNLKANILGLWGRKALEGLMDVSFDLLIEAEKGVVKRAGGSPFPTTLRVQGVIGTPSTAVSRSSPDRQYLFLNSRPCNLPKVQKAISEAWHSFCVNGHGFWVLDLILPTDTYDINVSPDKRSVLLHNEDNVLAAIKTAFEDLWTPTRSTFAVNGVAPTRSQNKRLSDLHSHIRGKDDAMRQLEKEFDPSSDGETGPLDSETQTNLPAPTQPIVPRFTSSSSTRDRSRKPSTHRDIAKQTSSERSSGDTGEEGRLAEGNGSADRLSSNADQLLSSPHHASSTSSQLNRSAIGDDLKDDSPRQSSPATPMRSTLSSLSASWSRNRSSPSEERPAKRRKVSSSVGDRASEAPPLQDAHSPTEGSGAGPSSLQDDDMLPEQLGDDEDVVLLPEAQLHVRDVVMDLMLDECDKEPSPNALKPMRSEVVDLTTDDEVSEPERNRPRTVPRKEFPKVKATEPPRKADPSPKVSTKKSLSAAVAKSVEVLRDGQRPERRLPIDMFRLRSSWGTPGKGHGHASDTSSISTSGSSAIAAGIRTGNAEAEKVLSRVISKADFENMEVLGQFNLGFIIVRLRREGTRAPNKFDELFIVDQHAADEKFNFESLQQTTRIQSQALLQPRPLELTPSDELVALENLEILRNNGFEIEVSKDEDDEPDNGSPEVRRPRISLTAQPVSKDTVFDMKDLEELLHLMQDTAKGQMVRCSKARAMFAMRACRKSVMVGKALTMKQMVSVIRHMGTMEQPWNCPHGRPTMRHLLSLPDYLKRFPPKAGIYWLDF